MNLRFLHLWKAQPNMDDNSWKFHPWSSLYHLQAASQVGDPPVGSSAHQERLFFPAIAYCSCNLGEGACEYCQFQELPETSEMLASQFSLAPFLPWWGGDVSNWEEIVVQFRKRGSSDKSTYYWQALVQRNINTLYNMSHRSTFKFLRATIIKREKVI